MMTRNNDNTQHMPCPRRCGLFGFCFVHTSRESGRAGEPEEGKPSIGSSIAGRGGLGRCGPSVDTAELWELGTHALRAGSGSHLRH